MNNAVLHKEVQEYVNEHLQDDVHRIAMSKSPFADVLPQELAGQIAAKKKAEKKLPTWFNRANIYYPPLLSIEQCSSEKTAEYKSSLIKGDHVLDLTGGFGVDSYYFSKKAAKVTHCEMLADLSDIAKYNAGQLGLTNLAFLNVDGINYLQNTQERFTTIYVDPARRGKSGKVFMLKDCSPDVVSYLDLLLSKASRVIIKTSPLLDISAGLKELKNVSEVQIISVKNECKELLFILDNFVDQNSSKEAGLNTTPSVKITSVAINEQIKSVTFQAGSVAIRSTADTKNVEAERASSLKADQPATLVTDKLKKYLYEPDVALLKSGAFDGIGLIYDLQKLDSQTQLYTSNQIKRAFPGRIFEIKESFTKNDLKKQKNLTGNVIVRNYPGKPDELVKAFKIKPSREEFLIFTRINTLGYLILKASILQYY